METQQTFLLKFSPVLQYCKWISHWKKPGESSHLILITAQKSKPKRLIQSYKGMNACHCFASITPPTILFMFYIHRSSLCKSNSSNAVLAGKEFGRSVNISLAATEYSCVAFFELAWGKIHNYSNQIRCDGDDGCSHMCIWLYCENMLVTFKTSGKQSCSFDKPIWNIR